MKSPKTKYQIRLYRTHPKVWMWEIYFYGKRHMLCGDTRYRTSREAAHDAEQAIPLDDEWPYGINTY
jgi:hypothetical protein